MAQNVQSIERTFIEADFRQARVNEIFQKIESLTSYKFVYKHELAESDLRLTMQRDSITVADLLLAISEKTGWSFMQINQTITVRGDPYVSVVEKQSFPVRGNVLNTNQAHLVNATVKVIELETGTTVLEDGTFTLYLPAGHYTLEASYVGYEKQRARIVVPNKDDQSVSFILKENSELQDLAVTDTRTFPLLELNSPVPVDNVTAKTLSETGHRTLDQQIAARLPSYNSTQQPISDMGAHFNAIDLRGLYSSRTLVLVNGKRKNTSALVYSYVTPGRGEVGVDMNSIPAAAIDRIEVLRDGASAQYGSDAVAGVINLVLEKRVDPFVNLNFSSTTRGDGQQAQVETGFGVEINKNGYINFTINHFDQLRTQRAGNVTSAEDESAYWKNPNYSLNDYRTYLTRNPSAGTQVGLPDMTINNFAFNSGYTVSESTKTTLYAFGSLMKRHGSAPQFTRVPYWVDGFQPLYPGQDYFLPEIAPEIKDHSLTVGMKTLFNQWNFDLSSTLGYARIDYFIVNSFNQSFGAASPTEFYNGAHQFNHFLNNIDITRIFKPGNLKSMTLAMGAESRNETFTTEAGEYLSYADGTPNDPTDRIGSESFPGFTPENASRNFRSNFGAYSEITTEFSETVMAGIALRFENYKDFGNNISWKSNTRIGVIKDKLNIRGSVGSGFRAPALHQIFYTALTTTLTPNGVVQNGILNNKNLALRALGIPKLQPETAFNVSSGITWQLSDIAGLALDFYQIDIKDRIVLSGQVTETGNPASPIDQVLSSVNTSSAGFFLNAADTKTRGLDITFHFDEIPFGKGILSGSVSANFNQTRVTSIHLPDFIENNNLQSKIFSREDISRIETWRPRQKAIATVKYGNQKSSVRLNLLYYGSVTYRHPMNVEDDRTYSGKSLIDLSYTRQFFKSLDITLGCNNIFNVYPDLISVTTDRNVDFVGRFKYPWQTTQFGIDGTRIFTQIKYSF